MSDIFKFNNVSLGYGSHIILKEVSLNVERGQYIGLVGANGAGKSTLLKAIIGSLKPLSGEITFFDDHGNTVKRLTKLGYMPQHQSLELLFPLSVFDVVLMGRYPQMGWSIWPRSADKEAVFQALERVKMQDFSSRHISELSGGQLQRVLMARAIVSEPELLLLDEPTNGMDLGASQDTLNVVNDLHKQGITVIIVTHILEIIAKNAQKVGMFHQKEDTTYLTWGDPQEVLTSNYLDELKIKR